MADAEADAHTKWRGGDKAEVRDTLRAKKVVRRKAEPGPHGAKARLDDIATAQEGLHGGERLGVSRGLSRRFAFETCGLRGFCVLLSHKRSQKAMQCAELNCSLHCDRYF